MISISIILFTICVQEWQLEVPNGYVQLVFEYFDIKYHSSCAYDWVEVSYESYSETTTKNYYSEKFCGPSYDGIYYNGNGDNLGRSIPGPFTSTGPDLAYSTNSKTILPLLIF